MIFVRSFLSLLLSIQLICNRGEVDARSSFEVSGDFLGEQIRMRSMKSGLCIRTCITVRVLSFSQFRFQTFTALMYSTGMFEERDVSLIVSVLITSNPDLRSRLQSCVSVIVFFPNPLGGFTR